MSLAQVFLNLLKVQWTEVVDCCKHLPPEVALSKLKTVEDQLIEVAAVAKNFGCTVDTSPSLYAVRQTVKRIEATSLDPVVVAQLFKH